MDKLEAALAIIAGVEKPLDHVDAFWGRSLLRLRTESLADFHERFSKKIKQEAVFYVADVLRGETKPEPKDV